MSVEEFLLYELTPFLTGWLLDLRFGDPGGMPHPVVGFGKLIAAGERRWNRGARRRLKGGAMAVGLIGGTFCFVRLLFDLLEREIRTFGMISLPSLAYVLLAIYLVFTSLAGTTLIREVRGVFHALDRSLDEGRKQVARIVGRDTRELSAQEVRTAALETLAENLSDGVIAPLCWYLLLGVPGMLAYKMANTLDSMIGYRTARYRNFGWAAARIDDVVNYLPARLTAFLMLLAHSMLYPKRAHFVRNLKFVGRFSRKHASPNSGYPEAALAAILDCRFGGPHSYFGERIPKPYIGMRLRRLTAADMRTAIRINRLAEVAMVMLTVGTSVFVASL